MRDERWSKVRGSRGISSRSKRREAAPRKREGATDGQRGWSAHLLLAVLLLVGNELALAHEEERVGHVALSADGLLGSEAALLEDVAEGVALAVGERREDCREEG